MKNLPEFKALIIRYETITIEEIEKAEMSLSELTKKDGICTLCIPLSIDDFYPDCEQCVYTKHNEYGSFQCITGIHYKTFYAMSEATTPKQLLTAYRNRAKHMRSILKKLNIE